MFVVQVAALHQSINLALSLNEPTRVLQPERLTVFDKWFSHDFAVPVPGVPGRQASAAGGRPPSGLCFPSIASLQFVK